VSIRLDQPALDALSKGGCTQRLLLRAEKAVAHGNRMATTNTLGSAGNLKVALVELESDQR
jgi:hypothetical protein